MKTGRPNLEFGAIPYFSRNRDETDVAYQRGWDDASSTLLIADHHGMPKVIQGAALAPYQKETLVNAYHAGFAARVAKDLE